MAKAVIKTTQTQASVSDFLERIENEEKKKDAYKVLAMMKKASGEEPKLWGTSLIGFGFLTIKSPATGREVDWFRIGFSPRKTNLSLYLPGSMKERAKELEKLGKHKTGMGCLYINKLADVDLKQLEKIIVSSLKKK